MSKKAILFSIFLCCICTSIKAQISLPGTPYSFKNQSLQSEKIPTIQTAPIDLQKLAKEDAADEADNLPPRFGHIFDVQYTLQNSGKWTTLQNGDRLWRLQIHCPDARSINLTYRDFYLPKGGKFHLYNPSKSKVLGTFTSHNNHKSRLFATNLIEDEQVVLEYYEPAAVKGQGTIDISRIVHGYRFIRSPQSDSEKTGFGCSAPCNVNINCSEGNDWQDQKRAVARIAMINSLCSGALVNNQTQDGTPYFLTANHCTGGFSAAQMNQFIFLFNYESPDCSNTNGSVNQSVTGATLRANLDVNIGSDFALLELNQVPPLDYQVYYAGWNNSSNPPSSAVGIHHPDGDIKKICIENQPLIMYPFSDHFWQVDDWDAGITAVGSSGSPIFDSNKYIVGQFMGRILFLYR